MFYVQLLSSFIFSEICLTFPSNVSNQLNFSMIFLFSRVLSENSLEVQWLGLYAFTAEDLGFSPWSGN